MEESCSLEVIKCDVLPKKGGKGALISEYSKLKLPTGSVLYIGQI
jgi:hypothetical protein